MSGRQSSCIVCQHRAACSFPGGTGGFLSLPECVCRVLLPHPQDPVTMSTRREGKASKRKERKTQPETHYLLDYVKLTST